MRIKLIDIDFSDSTPDSFLGVFMRGRLPFNLRKGMTVSIGVFWLLANFVARPSIGLAEELPGAARQNLLDQQFARPFLIDVDRPIDGLLNWYLTNRLERAEAEEADLIIVRLTTPGGDLEHSLNLSRSLRDIQSAKVVVWIPKEAISGGAIISLGADAVYMAPSAMLGDAGVIMLGPRGEFQHAEEKIISYAAASVSEIAQSTGIPKAVAEAMVDRKLKVYEATHKESGAKTYLSEREINDPKNTELFEIGDPISEAGNDRFLTVAAPRAKELGLCDEVFESEDQMLGRLSNSSLRSTSLDWKDRTVYVLNRPWLTALLLVIGIIGLYWEFSAPGLGLPGLSALFCFGVFFWSHFLGGTAGWFEVLMFCLGITCLLMEMFVLPGFGVFGVSGLAMIGVGLLMATQDFLIPESDLQWQELQTNSISVLGAFVILGILIAIQVMIFDTIPGLARFQLRPEEQVVPFEDRAFVEQVTFSKGDTGVCESDLRPSGKVLIGDRLVDVITEGDYVERGSQVAVIRIEGNIITVRKLSNS